MAKLSKRAQVEALGWAFVPVPKFWDTGALWRDPVTGQESPSTWDDKNPVGWLVVPPPGFPASRRRFNTSSPNPAVRWAYEQATAPRLKPDLGGVAGLVALMGEARRAGVVADGTDVGCILPVRPDAELLALCREVMSAARIADDVLDNPMPCSWKDRPAHQRRMVRLDEACRTRERLLPRVVEVEATTVAGVAAKAQAIELMFATSRGRRADAVRVLVADLVAVLQPGADAGEAPS